MAVDDEKPELQFRRRKWVPNVKDLAMKYVIAIGAAAVWLLFGAATAHADTDEDQYYVDLLSMHGITITPAKARAVGLAICAAAEAGARPTSYRPR